MLIHAAVVRGDHHDLTQRERHALTELVRSVNDRVPPSLLKLGIRRVSAGGQSGDRRVHARKSRSRGRGKLLIEKGIEAGVLDKANPRGAWAKRRLRQKTRGIATGGSWCRRWSRSRWWRWRRG